LIAILDKEFQLTMTDGEHGHASRGLELAATGFEHAKHSWTAMKTTLEMKVSLSPN
jgi:hypothetical protein